MGNGEGREKWKWREKMRVEQRGEQEGRAEETKWTREFEKASQVFSS